MGNLPSEGHHCIGNIVDLQITRSKAEVIAPTHFEVIDINSTVGIGA